MDKDPTLHRRILGDIENRILSGEWPPGHRIPFEMDLAAAYDCSRMTVNKALTQLAKAGLVERKKRSGTFVLQPRAQSAVLEIHDIGAEVQSLKLTYAFKVLTRAFRRTRAQEAVLRDDLKPGSRVLDVTCMHYAGRTPFCLEERVINLASVPEAADVDFTLAPPGNWLIAQVPWSNAQHKIQAIGAGQETAKLLQIPHRAACLVIERRTWSSAGFITYVRLTYPGDRHALVATFTPNS